MQRGNISRRGFMGRSLLTLGAMGLPAWYAKEALASESGSAPSPDAIRFGAIGIGSKQSRGLAIYNDARTQAVAPVRYVAACDVDGRHLDRALGIMKGHGFDAEGHDDYRALLARSDIDAVTIAVPDQWHALAAIEAMRQGKDVYCEKPLSLTIEDALAMVAVAHKTGRVLATGSQQRSDARFRLACELVRNGRIGKVRLIEARINSNPTSGVIPAKAVPREFNYDMWLGPCPDAEYVEDEHHGRCHYEFRWWYEYSGGKMTDWGAHHIDIAQWALGKDGTGPVEVEVLSSTPPSTAPNSYNVHPDFQVRYTYPEGTQLIALSKGGSGPLALVTKDGVAPKNSKGVDAQLGPDDNGVLFIGEAGTIFVNRGVILASDARLLNEPLPPSATRLEVSTNHMGNFIECIRSRKKPICTVEVGASSAIVCHIGVIATRLGKKLKWDPAKHQFDDEAANGMISRPARMPWKLEV